MPLTMIPLSRPFVSRVTSARKYRGITRVSPVNADIMHSFDRAGSIATFFLTIFTISKLLGDADSDSYDSYDGDDDDDYDDDDNDLIRIRIRESPGKDPQA